MFGESLFGFIMDTLIVGGFGLVAGGVLMGGLWIGLDKLLEYLRNRP